MRHYYKISVNAPLANYQQNFYFEQTEPEATLTNLLDLFETQTFLDDLSPEDYNKYCEIISQTIYQTREIDLAAFLTSEAAIENDEYYS